MPPEAAFLGDPDQVVDGRRRKGERRRRCLLEATLRVVGRDGPAAVTQRAVAREAGVPPSAVLYYFATVDELLVATLTMVNDTYVARIEAFGDDDARVLEMLAELIVAGTGRDRAAALAEYELCLMAARHPPMRGELDRWVRTLDRLAARVTADPTIRAGLTAVIDGLFLRACTASDPPDAGEVRQILECVSRRTPSDLVGGRWDTDAGRTGRGPAGRGER